MPVKIQLAQQSPLAVSADLLALAVQPGATVKQEPLASLDKAFSGALSKVIAREDFKGQKDQQLDLPGIGALPFAKIVLLGTRSTVPTLTRGLSATALVREGDVFLCDCGEGTQLQIMRSSVKRSRIHRAGVR